MIFPWDFWFFCIYFINVSFPFVQIFTLLSVALSKTSFQNLAYGFLFFVISISGQKRNLYRSLRLWI
jgi:hypothetical protein